MKMLIAVAALALLVIACSTEKTYETTFTCAEDGGSACVTGETCPTVPLDGEGCGDLPGFWGHSETKVDALRPVGCRVGLSYGNPYWGDEQQTCSCQRPPGEATGKPAWSCPV